MNVPHKLQKIVNMNVASRKLSKIEIGISDLDSVALYRDFRFRFRSLLRNASLLREYATPTLTPTNRPLV